MSNPAAWRFICAALVLLCLLPCAGGAAAPPAPPARGEDAVVLEEGLDVEILSESEAKVSYQNRTQVLTPRGVEEYGDAGVGYNPSIVIRGLHAAVISPSGKRQELKKQQFSDQAAFASYELYSDFRRKGIHFGGAEPGATLEYGYEESLNGLFFLPDRFVLQKEIPVRHLAVTVRAPASFPLRISVRGKPAYTREERDGVVIHRWEANDIAAFKDESGSPPVEDLLPEVRIYPRWIAYAGGRLDTESWDGVAGWYRQLARDRMAPGPGVAETARSATAGLTEPDAKIRRLYEFVQEKIGYVAVEMGVGGYQPHDNAEVFQHRYGDCKDKATLLIAMLRAVGLDGYPVLIRTRNEGLIEKENPSPSVFNHAIVAIPRSGGYLFLDPTSEATPFGELPWVDQGVPVLVVREDGRGDLVETPLAPADKNRRDLQVAARMTPVGGLEGDYVIRTWGLRRNTLSPILEEGKSAERGDALAGLLAGLCPGAVLKGHDATRGTPPEDAWKLAIRFEVPRYVLKAGTSELFSPQLARFPQFENLAAAASRRLPVFFPFLFSETSEVRLRLPTGRTVAKLPADRKSEGPGMQSATSYETARDAEGETLVVRRSLTVSRREIPPEDYPALRDFLSGLAREDAGALALASGD